MSDKNFTSKQAFWLGFRDALPFLLILVPFGMLFGVVGKEAGLSLLQVMAFSGLVVAGASQFTAVALLTDHAMSIGDPLAGQLVLLEGQATEVI